MVAGGYNSKERFLSSVEFLDLGQNLDNLSGFRTRWRSLPELKHVTPSNSLVLVDAEHFVHALGDNGVESFDKASARWMPNPYRTKRKRQFSVTISNVTLDGKC